MDRGLGVVGGRFETDYLGLKPFFECLHGEGEVASRFVFGVDAGFDCEFGVCC